MYQCVSFSFSAISHITARCIHQIIQIETSTILYLDLCCLVAFNSIGIEANLLCGSISGIHRVVPIQPASCACPTMMSIHRIFWQHISSWPIYFVPTRARPIWAFICIFFGIVTKVIILTWCLIARISS